MGTEYFGSAKLRRTRLLTNLRWIELKKYSELQGQFEREIIEWMFHQKIVSRKILQILTKKYGFQKTTIDLPI